MAMMTEQHAMEALQALAVRYAPAQMPWMASSQRSDWQQVRDRWVRTLREYQRPVVAAAIQRLASAQPQWQPNLNEMERYLREARRQALEAERELDERHHSRPSVARCNGTGWVDQVGHGLVPCQLCNGFLFDEYRNGRLGDTGAARDKRRQQWLEDNGAVTACVPVAKAVRWVSPADGMTAMWEAYALEAQRHGRTPNSEHFARLQARQA